MRVLGILLRARQWAVFNYLPRQSESESESYLVTYKTLRSELIVGFFFTLIVELKSIPATLKALRKVGIYLLHLD